MLNARLNFASDNAVTVHPKVWETLKAIDHGPALPYGQDHTTKLFEQKICDAFATDCSSFAITNGTACNSLILSALAKPDEAILCHNLSHIYNDECNAPELFTHGARLIPLAGDAQKCRVKDVTDFLSRGWASRAHSARPACLSITQLSELGCRYTAEEIRALANVCHEHDMRLHIDGARFANALAGGTDTAADLTHKCGVDALSLGFTKNGAFAAEAAIFFDHDCAAHFARKRKRGGQLWSKMRYISAQMLALLDDNTWIDTAGHANRMAQKLAAIFKDKGVEPMFPVDGNHVFVSLSDKQCQTLEKNGVMFYRWNKVNMACRFVTAWNTPQETLDSLASIPF